MNQKRKCSLLAAAAVLFGLLLFFAIAYCYRDEARNQKVEQERKQYEIAVQAELEALDRQYEQDMNDYHIALTQWEKDMSAYESYMEEYQSTLEEYNAVYEQQMATYTEKTNAYDAAVEQRKLAYESAYKRAETTLLQGGIYFTVNVNVSCNWNHHVGSDWKSYASVNGEGVWRNSRVLLKLGESVKFFSQRTEKDNIPDVGSAGGYYQMEAEDFQTAFTIEQQVTVRENRGKYAGNTAKFTFCYTLTPDSYTVKVDESSLPAIPDKPTEPEYMPPAPEMDEPQKPKEPAKPTMADVSIQEPKYDAIEVSLPEVYCYSAESRYIIAATLVVLVASNMVVIPKIRKRG